MPDTPPQPPADPPTARTRAGPDAGAWWFGLARRPGATITLVLILLGARVLWHMLGSDLTLAEDEAHYWQWSLHPAWSYYSKGPGVAWILWASTALFGHEEWAIRLPAAVSGALGALGAAALARWAFAPRRDPAQPFVAAVLFCCVPAFALASVLMTIDAPLLTCWAWGAAFAALGVLGGRRWAWVALGAGVGAGFLFKFTILLLIPGVVLGAFVTRRERPPIPRGPVVLGCVLAGAGVLPVLVWNAAHGWPTLRHLLGHLALPGGDLAATPVARPWSPLWALEYLGLQLLLAGPLIVLAGAAWKRTRVPGGDARAVRFCIALALPVYIFYLVVSLMAPTEANWAVAGAVSLTPPAAWGVLDAVRRRSWPGRFCWGAALAAGILATTAPAFLGFLNARRVIGPFVPIERVTGMGRHAADAARRLDALGDETGLEPFVMTDHYGRASQLTYYLPGRPTVFNAASLLGGRRSQHDLWAETDPCNPATARALIGRPALLISAPDAHWAPAFADIRPIGPLDAEPGGRTAYLGLGFRGFGGADSPDDPGRGRGDGQ